VVNNINLRCFVCKGNKKPAETDTGATCVDHPSPVKNCDYHFLAGNCYACSAEYVLEDGNCETNQAHATMIGCLTY
jgi:hypothetical protein